MAQKEGQVWEKYAPLPERGKHLLEKADALKGSLEKDFATTAREKRDEIERELKAAAAVSEQIRDLSDKVVSNSVRFVKQSADLLTAAPTPRSSLKTRVSAPKEGRAKARLRRRHPPEARMRCPSPKTSR